MAHWRVVEEVDIAVTRLLQFDLELLQVGVLHLEFELMYLQFVNQPDRVRYGSKVCSRRFLCQTLLGLHSERGGEWHVGIVDESQDKKINSSGQRTAAATASAAPTESATEKSASRRPSSLSIIAKVDTQGT